MEIKFNLNPSVLTLLGGLILTTSSGTLWALQKHFDGRYLLIADSLQGKLLDRQRDLIVEESKDQPNQKLIEEYKIQIEELKQKLGK